MQKRGYKAFYDPRIRVEREQRKSIGQFIGQMSTYGRGRADQFRFQPSSFNLSLLVPPCFAVYLTAFIPVLFLLHGGWQSAVWSAPIILHLLMNLVFSLEAAVRGRNILMIFILPLLFMIVHFCYGLGLIAGMMPGNRKKKPNPLARIDHESLH